MSEDVARPTTASFRDRYPPAYRLLTVREDGLTSRERVWDCVMLWSGAWAKGFCDRATHGASTLAHDRTWMGLMRKSLWDLVAQHS